MRLLARREHTRQELTHKLKLRGLASAAIQQALARLESEQLLSDARFAELYAQARAQRGYGPLRIEAELRTRGVARAVVEQSLSDMEIDWASQAIALYRKRYGEDVPEDLTEYARRVRFLTTRGFAGAMIKAVLKDVERLCEVQT